MTLPKIICKNTQLCPDRETIIMGVLNVTPDSFSDGGRFQSVEAIKAQARRLLAQGAHIIDIGGESSRPFSEPVSLDEELSRVIPAIRAVREISKCAISIDTTKSQVAKRALEEGADIVNDISGLRFDPEMASVVADAQVPVIIMHMKGTPRDMQVSPVYEDVVAEINEFFQARIEYCISQGIKRERIILDPGIGFGKRFEDNLDIINSVEAFCRFNLPVLIGASRKAFLGQITGRKEPSERDNATCGAVVAAILNGASIVRVHDVSAVADAVKVADALKRRREAIKR